MNALYPHEVRRGFEYSILPSVAKYGPETLFSDCLDEGNLGCQSLMAADTDAAVYLKAAKVQDYECENAGRLLLIEFPQPDLESELFYAASFLTYADVRDSDELSCPYYFLAKADDGCIFGEVSETEDDFEPIAHVRTESADLSEFLKLVLCRINVEQ